MRKLVTALLLAGTLATPLLAQDRPDQDKPSTRDQREAKPAHDDRAPDQGRRDHPDQPQRAQDRDHGPDRGPPPQPPRDMRGPGADRPDHMQPRPDDRRGPDQAWDRGGRDDHRFDDRNGRPAYGYRGNDHAPGRSWSRDWRHDGRYNWQSYRSANRYLFRGPRWYAPRGANYRRFAIGYRFDPVFYGERYWISDPWLYRLPPAYGPYRWVRYYDDVALVNIYTGQIADIIYSFFD